MHKGACGCGAVTYHINSDPMFVHCCHCHKCQQQSGSAFVLNAIIESDRVETNGPTREDIVPSPSGEGQAITRCEACGVALFSNYLVRGRALSFVRVGTLDDPSACPPDVHIHTDSKVDWLSLDDRVPVFSAFYDFHDLWPKAAIDRRKAALAG